MLRFAWYIFAVFCLQSAGAQVVWHNVDTAFGKLPKGFHVFRTNDSVDKKPFIAYYAEVNLNKRSLKVSTDTSLGRRLTPTQFYRKNGEPLLVVNTTFFSFSTNKSLNLVVKDGSIVAWPERSRPMRGRDTFNYLHSFSSAIGFDKSNNPDIAWVYAHDSLTKPLATQFPFTSLKDSVDEFFPQTAVKYVSILVKDSVKGAQKMNSPLQEWHVQTAVGGGPVLVQGGRQKITNNEELKFTGKRGLEDRHPRTLIGYTADKKLIIMVVQGRFPGIAEGATLPQLASLMIDLGCVEALNLDGGGSSCMLINGRQTIKPSDGPGLQRAIPAVLVISKK